MLPTRIAFSASSRFFTLKTGCKSFSFCQLRAFSISRFLSRRASVRVFAHCCFGEPATNSLSPTISLLAKLSSSFPCDGFGTGGIFGNTRCTTDSGRLKGPRPLLMIAATYLTAYSARMRFWVRLVIGRPRKSKASRSLRRLDQYRRPHSDRSRNQTDQQQFFLRAVWANARSGQKFAAFAKLYAQPLPANASLARYQLQAEAN